MILVDNVMASLASMPNVNKGAKKIPSAMYFFPCSFSSLISELIISYLIILWTYLNVTATLPKITYIYDRFY